MTSRHRCIFHVGLPKTGSSSVQAFLRGRVAELLDHGIRFPAPTSEAARKSSEGRIPHSDLIHHFYKLARPATAKFIDYDQVVEQSRRDPPGTLLLLTHEVQALHGHNARQEVFADLATTHDIEFLCYLRNPASWLASFYEQAVSQPNAFIADPARHFATRGYLEKGFRGMMAPFRNMGDVALRDYDALRSGGQLVPEFLRHVGAGAFVQTASAAPRVNAHAYSPEQITIMRYLKTQGTESPLFVRVRNVFDLFNTSFKRQRSPIVLFPAELRAAIERQWLLDREALGSEVTLTGISPAPEPGPYRDDAEMLDALADFSASAQDPEAVAAIQSAVTVSRRALA